MRALDRGIAFGRLGTALVVAAVLLTGCTADPGGSAGSATGPSPIGTAGPDASPSAPADPGLVVERPAPLWSITCAEIAAAFGSSLDGLTFIDAPVAQSSGEFANPLAWRDSVTNQGGLNCVWGNAVGLSAYVGEPYIYTRGAPLGEYYEARYLSVVALPGAAAGYRSLWGFTGTDFSSAACQWNQTLGYTNADFEAAVGDDWVRINLMLGPTGCDQHWTPRIQQLLERIQGSRLPGAVVRPAEVPALPANCTALIAPVDALLTAPVGAYTLALPDQIEPFASLRRSKLQCAWGSEWPTALTVLEGGAWLLPDYHAWAATQGTPIAIESGALRPGDEAWMIPDKGSVGLFWASLRGNLYRGWVGPLPAGQEAARMSALLDVLADWQSAP